MRIFDADTIRSHVGLGLALEAVETAFIALAEGRATLPPPVGLELPEVRGEVHVKGAHLQGARTFTFKVATGFYRNPERGLPSGSGLMLVFDAGTGVPLALLQDEGYLTDLRTAAAGALAARHLTPTRIPRAAVLGTGVQGRLQMLAIAEVCEIGELRAWSPRPESVARYCSEMEGRLGIPVRAAGSPAEAARDAGLIVTATPSRMPLLEADAVGAGATVIAVGSDGPDKGELDPEILARADKIVTDRTEQCARLGELHHALEEGWVTREDVHAELGQIVAGFRPGREGNELIVCDLTGVGVQDAAIAEAALDALVPLGEAGP